MEASLIRTSSGSVPVQSSIVSGPLRRSLTVRDFIGAKSSCASSTTRRISLHLEADHRGIRRVSSEPALLKSAVESCGTSKTLNKIGSRHFPSKILEEEVGDEDFGSFTFTEDFRSFSRSWPEIGIPAKELGFTGGDTGKNWNTGGNGGSGGGDDHFTGGSADRRNLGAYYEEMLKLNPRDSLLLRNYGKYLHEVERDTVKAEEYYSRAILASPGDGEVLSLYGKLIWETQRDENRAKCYFDRAVHASPDDCMVLGSYAHFMWEAEEEEEEEHCVGAAAGPAMVGAY